MFRKTALWSRIALLALLMFQGELLRSRERISAFTRLKVLLVLQQEMVSILIHLKTQSTFHRWLNKLISTRHSKWTSPTCIQTKWWVQLIRLNKKLIIWEKAYKATETNLLWQEVCTKHSTTRTRIQSTPTFLTRLCIVQTSFINKLQTTGSNALQLK